MPPPPARPQSRKRKRSRRRRPHAPRDPLESEVAVEYEVGCVLEDLLRCVHAVCDLGVDPDCEPCLDLWDQCECDEAAVSQGLEDRCAACARKPAWCAGCAQLAAVAVGRCLYINSRM
jgi:hypothetical protein